MEIKILYFKKQKISKRDVMVHVYSSSYSRGEGEGASELSSLRPTWVT